MDGAWVWIVLITPTTTKTRSPMMVYDIYPHTQPLLPYQQPVQRVSQVVVHVTLYELGIRRSVVAQAHKSAFKLKVIFLFIRLNF